MGIHGLSKVIGDHAPSAIKENDIKNLFGRKVAIDASMSIYQFLIAVRQNDGMQLQNESGETTSHIIGLFYRTIRMLEHGIKPVYVFDGAPPEMKSGELAKRLVKRVEAQKEVEKAVEGGDIENFDKFSRRTVRVTKEHNAECKRLLTCMGVPYVDAPGEAEAQCAAFARSGKVFGAGSEDMDTLTFGTPVLLRHLSFSEARKMPINEIFLDKVLEGLEMDMDQFIDLCILLGCDYCDSIKGIGPKKAVDLIKEHKTIEQVLKHIDMKKYPVAEDWPFAEARKLFISPTVTDPDTLDLKWSLPNEEALIQFLCREKEFSEDRVRKGIAKLVKCKNTATQGRLDSFFKIIPKDPSIESKKRKSDAKPAAIKKKVGSGRPRK